jgi:membrane protein DedA with SNARE-associated domain
VPVEADATTAGTSLVEVAGYGVLGALIAAGVFLVGDQPAWQAIMIVAGAVVLLVVAIVWSRDARRRATPSVASSTGTRRGRGRHR